MEQVAVGGVQLDQLEASRQRAFGGASVGSHDAVDLTHRQRFGRLVAGGEGNRAGADDGPGALRGGQRLAALPGTAHARLAPGMGKLDAGTRAGLAYEAGDA